MATPKTALVINESVSSGHKCLWDADYPERPDRLLKAVEALRERNILPRCHLLTPRRATIEELTLCHPADFVELVRSTETAKEDELKALAESCEEVYFCNATYESAVVSVGSALQAMDSVIDETSDNAFALIRPPGHHAYGSNANGFCIFNNVAICAKVAVERRGIRRVLIVDWDVHPGQGTQYLVQGDDRILFISIHQYLNGFVWPYQKDVDYDSEYANVINIPLNIQGAGDAEYMAAFCHLILPMAAEFDPQLILVSCGFDAAIGDPLGRMNVTPAAFGHMIRLFQSFCPQGKVCAVLEGGYFIPSLVECVCYTVKGLLGDSLPALAPMQTVNPAFVETLWNVAKHHAMRWECLRTALSALSEMRGIGGLGELRQRSLFEFGGKSFRESTDDLLRTKTFPIEYGLSRSRELDEQFDADLRGMMAEYAIKEAEEKRIVATVESLDCRAFGDQLSRLYSLSMDRGQLISVVSDSMEQCRILSLELGNADTVTVSTDSENITMVQIPFDCNCSANENTPILCHVLLPILYSFSPQLTILSIPENFASVNLAMPLLRLCNLVSTTVIFTTSASAEPSRKNFPAQIGKIWSELASANIGIIHSLLLNDQQHDISYQNQILSMAEQITAYYNGVGC